MTEEMFKDLCLSGETTKVQFQNDSDGNEFKVTLFRGVLDTIQKYESTIQKEVLTIQKAEITTQKAEITTQKKHSATQKEEITTQKRVLDYLRENPKATRVEVADALGNITADGVKFIIAKLQQKGVLKCVGGRKHDEWVVSNNIKGWQGYCPCDPFSEYPYAQILSHNDVVVAPLSGAA